MKNENLANELKSELNSICKILTMAMQCYEFSSYLYSPSTENESDYANESFFTDFTRHIYWRNLVIELSKLITDSKNQNFNIFKLLQKLKNDGCFGKLELDNEKIENWESLLTENSKTINDLTTLRNKIYSHTDRDKENYLNSEITFNEIKILIEELKNIIESIFMDVLKTHVEIRPLKSTEKNFRVLKILAEEKDTTIKKTINDFIECSN